jgi:cellulose synthase/poly-beta-1,6-N-acetylglucosamine synthase-like glycosyltransferase
MKNLQDNLPFVSIIIPCRNEEKFIGKCLESILNQDYPKEKMEVLVVDGMSEDRTREIISNLKSKISKPQIRLINNPKKFTNFAFNIGIKEAKGEIIMLAGAHATYEKDYVSKCVKYLKEYNANCVGGVLKTIPAENTLIAKAIAISLSHPFGSASYFRIGAKAPKEVDTVFGGCYKKEVFEKIGLFNEKLIRSQDLEFNLRLKKAGGKILLFPDIVAYYYPQSNFKNFFLHNFQDGIWAILPFKLAKTPFKLRHYIPLFFILTFPISIWPYILLSLFLSAQIAFKEKDLRLFFLTPIAFFCRHFSYGLGSIWGLLKML